MTDQTELPNQMPPMHRAEGITSAERYLQRLCERSFLTLWSYPGVFRDQGRNGRSGHGKEVADLLVVFENHIIIFSDKDCVYPDTGDTQLDWRRWFRRAIAKSADQLWGAERWLRERQDKLFLDRACTQPFPLDLPDVSSAQIHRIVVAHDRSGKLRRLIGGSGSLMLTSEITTDGGGPPFVVGPLDPEKGFVHVFDEAFLDIVMNALDTITDFVDYLSAKVRLLSSFLIGAAGEEEVLAYYLTHINVEGKHHIEVPEGKNGVLIGTGYWEEFINSEERKKQVHANGVSYLWDQLIERFSQHIVGVTQYYASHPGVGGSELIMRFFARETRTRRRMLSLALIDLMRRTPSSHRATRIISPSNAGEPYYLFLLFPRIDGVSYESYRERRQRFLEDCCVAAKSILPAARDIVGFATETERDPDNSEDAVYLDAREWTDSSQEEAESLRQHRGLFVNLTRFEGTVNEYPE